MLVTIRTIAGASFKVEAEATDTLWTQVEALKEKAVSSCPEGVTLGQEGLLLIHKGKVLKDEETLKDVNIVDGSFCVAMQKKVPVKPQPQPTPTGSSSAAQPAEKEPKPEEEQEGTTSEGQPARLGSYDEAASTLLVGSQLESQITQICEMGFERSQVVRALHAAFNNPNRAVEYLMNGIPQTENQPPPATGTPHSGVAQAVGGTPADQTQTQRQGQGPNTQPLNLFRRGGSGGGDGGGGALDFLRDNPQFNILRHLVSQNPQVLQPMLQELSRSNPQLLRQINEHQQEFLSLLTEHQSNQGEADAEAVQGLMQLAGQEAEGLADVDPGVPTITISEEEAQAIDRLESLGFDRDRCVEAFLICDKNEEIAANYLLEHADDA